MQEEDAGEKARAVVETVWLTLRDWVSATRLHMPPPLAALANAHRHPHRSVGCNSGVWGQAGVRGA
eukprot:1952033-Rhodomonas_salina.1